MARPSTDSKERLLNTAVAIFAEKGFQNTTSTDICDRARLNIALINYYYGSRDELYEAVWEHLFTNVDEYFESTTQLSPEEALRLVIKKRLTQIADSGPGGWLPRIVHGELGNPSNLLPKLMKAYIMPVHERFLAVIGDYLGPNASETDIEYGAFSINSICMGLNVSCRGENKLLKVETTTEKLDLMTGKLTSCAMGALRELKDQIEPCSQEN